MKRRPIFWMLLFYIAFAPLIPTYLGVKPGGIPLINLHRIYCSMMIFLFIYNIVHSTEYRDLVLRSIQSSQASFIVVGSLLAWRIFSVIFSDRVGYSAFIVGLEIILGFLIFAIAAVELRCPADFEKALKALSIGALGVVIIGGVEYTLKMNLFRALIPASAMESDYIAGAAADKWRDGYRVGATFLHPIVLGQYLAFMMPLLCINLCLGLARSKVSILLVSTIAGAVFLANQTGARSALLAIGVALVLTYILLMASMSRRQSAWGLVIMIMGIVSGYVGLVGVTIYQPDLADKIQGLIVGSSGAEASSTDARYEQMRLGLGALEKRPLVGVGPGLAIEYAYTGDPSKGTQSIDSYFLSILVDAGYPSLILFVAINIYFVFLALKSVFSPVPGIAQIAAGIMVSIISFNIVALIVSSNEIITYLFVVFGCLCGIDRYVRWYNGSRYRQVMVATKDLSLA